MRSNGDPILFSPITFRSIEARNRIMVSPMCQYSAPDAIPSDWHLVHLGSRALGGAGIAMTEATAVEPIGRISLYDVGLWNDDQEQSFRRIAEFVASSGAVPGIQLAHAGRKASHSRPWEGREVVTSARGGWEPVGPSPIPWATGDPSPRELSTRDISNTVDAFASASLRALRAGFRVLEIHAAHGYLIDSFLSPLSNSRSDEYGGRFENRVRFLREVITAVRTVWPPDLPLFVRLSCTEWVDGGWTLDDTVKLCATLQDLGVDLIDCSAGGNSSAQSIRSYPGYQVPFAEAVRGGTGLATAAVGLLDDPVAMEKILTSGQADVITLGRILLWDPYWPHHAAATLGVPNQLPVQYERSVIHARRHVAASSPANADAVRLKG